MSKKVCNKDSNNLTLAETKHYSHDEAVELVGNGCYNIGLLVVCSIISNAVALDMFGFGLVVASSACDLNLTMNQKGILSSIPFAGLLFSYPWGYFADTRGRRLALLWSTSVGFVFAALSSLSSTWYMMLILKFIGTSFSTAAFTLTITLLGECTGQRHRGQYLLVMNSINLASEAVSFLLAFLILPLDFYYSIPWLGIIYRPWRLLTFVMAVPLALGALMMIFFHESPKFLANRGDTEKSMNVLRDMYEKNGGIPGDYVVKYLRTENDTIKSLNLSIWQSIWVQTAPIFQPPLLWRTLQLYYLVIIICSTNNVFVMWFPTIVNLFYLSFSDNLATDQSFCDRIIANVSSNTTGDVEIAPPCNDIITDNTIWAGISYGIFFTILNLLVSNLASWRRLVLLGTLLVSAFSGMMINLVNDPIASMIFFILLQGTSIGLGIAASYFVDLYPTTLRGMTSSLGFLVARVGSFSGVNLVGAVIGTHCSHTFYMWSIFVLSGVAVSLFLPPDREKKTYNVTR